MIYMSIHDVVSVDIDGSNQLIGCSVGTSAQKVKIEGKDGSTTELTLFYRGDRPLISPANVSVSNPCGSDSLDTKMVRALLESASPHALAEILDDIDMHESCFGFRDRSEFLELRRTVRMKFFGLVGHFDHKRVLEERDRQMSILEDRKPNDYELLRALFGASSPITLANLLADLDVVPSSETTGEIARIARGHLIGIVGHADHKRVLEEDEIE